MELPIITTKDSIHVRIIVFTILAALVLCLLICMRSDLLNYINYGTLEILIITILFVQFSYFMYFFITKKYRKIGNINFNNESIIITLGKESKSFNTRNIADFRLLVIGNITNLKTDIFGFKVIHNGYYVIFQYNNKTIFHEILIKNKCSIDELIGYIHSNIPEGKIEIN
jgi:hypothetical protein